MCSYSAAIRERAEADGRAEGIAKGKAEGRAQERTLIILNMLHDGDSDEKIRRITNCNQSEIDAIRAKL